jgi:hypothetical protein
MLELLPGIPVEHVMERLAQAGGNEIESGKLASPESSAALAVNCFGWFIPRPERLPALPGLDHAGIPHLVDVEFCARFPWRGGTHPWLDAVVQTPTRLIGVESKRFEPFRDAKKVDFSPAYDGDVWGPDMKRFERLRDRLRSGMTQFKYLDAAQLVKHAFGLVTVARRRKLSPALFYLFAEPGFRAGQPIDPNAIMAHRREVAAFAAAVAGDEVEFSFSSYRDWLSLWPTGQLDLASHRDAVLEQFAP